MVKLRETVETVDYTIGKLVSKNMCSKVCPCNFVDIPKDEQGFWLGEKFADTNVLDYYGRCNSEYTSTCEAEKDIIYVTQKSQSIVDMTGYDIPTYSSFKDCFEDLKSGKRDSAQVSEEKSQSIVDMTGY